MSFASLYTCRLSTSVSTRPQATFGVTESSFTRSLRLGRNHTRSGRRKRWEFENTSSTLLRFAMLLTYNNCNSPDVLSGLLNSCCFHRRLLRWGFRWCIRLMPLTFLCKVTRFLWFNSLTSSFHHLGPCFRVSDRSGVAERLPSSEAWHVSTRNLLHHDELLVRWWNNKVDCPDKTPASEYKRKMILFLRKKES